MEVAAYVTAALVGYLFGSIPTGYLVARARGIDIRAVGSGNIGATNAFRVLGKPAGVAVLAVDALKGLAACTLVPLLVAILFPETVVSLSGMEKKHHVEVLAIVGGLAAILGHNFPCWLRFKGGKGIATSAGVLLAWTPWALLIVLATFLVVLALTRYVSMGSIAAAFILPFAVWLTRESGELIVINALMGGLAIYKHKPNIQRLLNGTESRFDSKKPKPASPS